MIDLLWANENKIIAAGHDNMPFSFAINNGSIANGVSLDKNNNSGISKSANGPSNMSTWQNRDKLGAADGSKGQELKTLHQNCITVLQPFSGAPNNLTSFSTTALDGNIAVWKL